MFWNANQQGCSLPGLKLIHMPCYFGLRDWFQDGHLHENLTRSKGIFLGMLWNRLPFPSHWHVVWEHVRRWFSHLATTVENPGASGLLVLSLQNKPRQGQEGLIDEEKLSPQIHLCWWPCFWMFLINIFELVKSLWLFSVTYNLKIPTKTPSLVRVGFIKALALAVCFPKILLPGNFSSKYFHGQIHFGMLNVNCIFLQENGILNSSPFIKTLYT